MIPQKLLQNQGVLPIHLGGAALCLIIVAAGWWIGLGPLMSDSEQAFSFVQEATLAEEQAAQSQSELVKLEHSLAQIKAELFKQPVSLEPASQINALLGELADWAEGHELNITRTNAGRPVALAYYDYVPISLAGEGAYVDMLQLLSQMHEQRGDIGLITFNASRLPSQAGVKFELQLAWYVISDDAAAQQPVTASVPTP